MFISTLSFSQDSTKNISEGIEKLLDLYAKAVKKLDNHDIEGAYTDANEIINSDPNLAKAYGLRGYINYFFKKSPESAIADFYYTDSIKSDKCKSLSLSGLFL